MKDAVDVSDRSQVRCGVEKTPCRSLDPDPSQCRETRTHALSP